MAYARSAAKRQLDAELLTIKARVRLSKTGVIPVDLREYVLAAAIFLAHAELENYFSDVIDKLVALHRQKATVASKLPPRMRAHLFLGRSNLNQRIVSRFAGGDEPSLLDSVASVFSGPAASLMSDVQPLDTFTGAELLGDHSYPSTKNIYRVLKRFGIGDPKAKLNGALKRDVISLLESLASLRTGLAHSATLPGITPEDVISRIDGLADFARAFDLVLYEHVKVSHTAAAWTAMR